MFHYINPIKCELFIFYKSLDSSYSRDTVSEIWRIIMALYDELIDILRQHPAPALTGPRTPHEVKAAIAIEHLQSIIRNYNPDDAIFDDEKKEKVDLSKFIIAESNDEDWPNSQSSSFLQRVKIIPIKSRIIPLVEQPE